MQVLFMSSAFLCWYACSDYGASYPIDNCSICIEVAERVSSPCEYKWRSYLCCWSPYLFLHNIVHTAFQLRLMMMLVGMHKMKMWDVLMVEMEVVEEPTVLSFDVHSWTTAIVVVWATNNINGLVFIFLVFATCSLFNTCLTLIHVLGDSHWWGETPHKHSVLQASKMLVLLGWALLWKCFRLIHGVLDIHWSPSDEMVT